MDARDEEHLLVRVRQILSPYLTTNYCALFFVIFILLSQQRQIWNLQNDVYDLRSTTENPAIPANSPSSPSVPKDIVFPVCVHGDLDSYNTTCICDDGWEGERCDQAVCPPSCKNGFCSSPHVCTCHSGWLGTSCDQKSFEIPIAFDKSVSISSQKAVIDIVQQLVQKDYPTIKFKKIAAADAPAGPRDVVLFVVNAAGSTRLEVNLPSINEIKKNLQASNVIFLTLQYKNIKTSIAKSGIQFDDDTFQNAGIELRLDPFSTSEKLKDQDFSQASVDKAMKVVYSYLTRDSEL